MQGQQLTKIQRRLERRFAYKAARRRAIRYFLLAVNMTALLIVVWFIAQSPHRSNLINQTVPSNTSSLSTSSSNPLDIVSSASIALTVARITNLPEATAVKNEAESVNAQLSNAPSYNAVASKPQVVATAFKSREDIQSYTAKSGDSVSSIANHFGITSDSLKWSNNLNSDAVIPGVKLVIPPVNGIVYTVKTGDSPEALAQKYSSSLTQLIAYNDAEIYGIHAGEQIIIPNGQVPSAPTYSFYATYTSGGANGYDYGFCTWYVASQISVPSNWGNASSWAYYAGLSGWTVSTSPKIGSIAQTAYAAGGEGHVAIVDAVSPDGSQIQFKDMNGIAGYARVGQSGWVPISAFQHYIYH